jgi:beta-alanine--pyruvate transaminase
MTNATALLHPDRGELDLRSLWMPFTHNRYFKKQPLLVESAQGCHYTLTDGRVLFDCLSGLWCSPLGHAHPGVVAAVQRQVERLDYSPGFQVGHAAAFTLAAKIASLAGRPGDQVFFVNSGSEAIDTAMKIAVGYHRVRGEPTRTRFIGRERAYHGVGLGGISIGGIAANRKMFGSLMVHGVDHLPHTWDPKHMAYSRGQPEWGAHLAEDLERLVTLHDASNIAAVVVEPMQGSTGVIVPPKGYLERLRQICTQHDILLIFDEVITGFGRLGKAFAADYFGVAPDMITFAKAVSNGVVPLGGVLVKHDIYQAFMTGPAHAIELFHGYTYSGHPLAVAAGNAALDAMTSGRLFERAAQLSPILEDAMHSLKREPHVTDIRNIGLAAAIECAPVPGQPGVAARRIFERALDEGLLVRFAGDAIAVAPPFVCSEKDILAMVEGLRRALRAVPTA